MNQAKRIEILKVLQADNPDPKSELEYSTPFELLIAVVLSAQATDKSVNEATRHIFPIANTPEKLLVMGPETLLDDIKKFG
uniref:endonuclease III domain-containing protein n=1 Tax=Turicimonas muris TaxID=1796652 RepID=UPI00402A7117